MCSWHYLYACHKQGLHANASCSLQWCTFPSSWICTAVAVRLLSHHLNPPPNLTWTHEQEISFLTLRCNEVTTWRVLQKELSFCFFWWTTCITVMNYLCEHCRKDQPNPKCRIAACLLGVAWCETTTKVSESGLLERSMCQFSVVVCWWCEGQSWPSGRQVPVCGMWKGSEKQPLSHRVLEMWKVDPCSMWRSFPWRVSPTELTWVCERALVLSSLSGGLPFCDASINSSSTSLGIIPTPLPPSQRASPLRR